MESVGIATHPQERRQPKQTNRPVSFADFSALLAERGRAGL